MQNKKKQKPVVRADLFQFSSNVSKRFKLPCLYKFIFSREASAIFGRPSLAFMIGSFDEIDDDNDQPQPPLETAQPSNRFWCWGRSDWLTQIAVGRWWRFVTGLTQIKQISNFKWLIGIRPSTLPDLLSYCCHDTCQWWPATAPICFFFFVRPQKIGSYAA